ncbi:MAG TPA: peptide ABC transporter substrate-binding protein [Verrucomicrobiae bacterium]|nr:peptide ABC transporter substrate-binding protein [Verrucomicrobiae bacterium]
MRRSGKPEIRARAKRTFFRFCVLACGILLLAAGCGRPEPPADLTIINGADPESLDPAIITGQPDMRVVQSLFEGLTRVDPKTGGAIPGLAERWDISPDGTIYTFHLRTNLVWSTGEPITADDVVFSWIRALDPAMACEYAGQLYYVKNGEAFNAGKITDPSKVGVHALDPYTVRVELLQPTTFFLDLCAMPIMSVVPRKLVEKFGDDWVKQRPLPSSGPYELVYWRLNDKIRIRKNPRYWDAANTSVNIFDLLPIASPTVALNLYERGQVDIVWDKDLVPTELLDVLLKRPDFHTFDYLGTYFIDINVTRKPFDDPRVRKALALAIDKKRILTRLLHAGEKVATGLVPDGTANYTGAEALGYNPDLARKLLAEAGYPGGKGFPHFTYMFNAAVGGAAKMHEKIAVELQQMWRDELGIHMEMRQLEWKVYLNAQSQLDYDLSRASWIGDYDDANTFLDMFMSDNGNNRTGWKDPRYDALVREANSKTNIKVRAELLRQAETILVHDEAPVVPLFFYKGLDYFDPSKVQGIYFNILDQHPLSAIRRVGREARAESRVDQATVKSNGKQEDRK